MCFSESVVGFNVETVLYRNVNFVTWDVGSRDKIVSVGIDQNIHIMPVHVLPTARIYLERCTLVKLLAFPSTLFLVPQKIMVPSPGSADNLNLQNSFTHNVTPNWS